jgi:hypothetical protein
MTNKRITELTALDGDDVADNDVLAIVDVSDTTMAASGTTKKITVAELVTDSALKGAFWPNSTTALAGSGVADADKLPILDGTVAKYIEASELAQATQFSSRYLQTGATALTGANLANGDKFGVVDVGSPDVVKTITADELAQGSQFSGRYKPLASDTIFIGSGSLELSFGSPSLSRNGITPVWNFDASSIETVGTTLVFPPSWATFDAYIMWGNASTGSGNVFWRLARIETVDGGATNSGELNYNQTIAAPSVNILKKSSLASGLTITAGALSQLEVQRVADDAGDTLGNDAMLRGLLLVRAS